MINNNVLIPCGSGGAKVINPMGAILKNSDKVRASVLVGVAITNQPSLSRASDLLVAAGYPKVKCRLTTDLTATGINAASYSPPFRYPSLGDVLRVVRRDGFLTTGDVSRYFHSFPLALEARQYWTVEWGNIIWAYARCCFGHTACPYYASTWSAEFRQWALAIGLDPAFMMDDWLLCLDTKAEAQAGMQKLCTIFEDSGFAMSVDKFQCGQQLVFIGVLIDTVTMTLRFESTQARGMRLQLETYLNEICKGSHLDHTTIRHVCGKLNWYSEVVQSGRMHNKSWWDYQRNGAATYTTTINKLLLDTQWWINLLKKWEEGSTGQLEYRILSADLLRTTPKSLCIVQSDASGIDGFGYYSSYLEDSDMKYTSKQWVPKLDPNIHSHCFELLALEDFISTDCEAEDAVLVWLTDNEGAVWSVNKGRCSDEQSAAVLESILNQCDNRKLQIIALWVPRERNEFADYLSHLAFYMNRDVVKGLVSELQVSAIQGRDEDRL
jgi:hypothetical protein